MERKEGISDEHGIHSGDKERVGVGLHRGCEGLEDVDEIED